MFTFFKRFRASVLNSEKEERNAASVTRYFGYAVGEVVLVMIGILMALQVNNWNSQRLLKNDIRSSYQKLVDELNYDQKAFRAMDSIISKHIGNAKEIQKVLARDNTLKDIDTLRSFVRFTNFPLNYTNRTFQSLVSTGLLSRAPNREVSNAINAYYLELDNAVFLFENMGRANRAIRDSPELFPLQYILRTPDSLFIVPDRATEWMNDPNSLSYQGIQYYLTFYLRQHGTKRNNLSQLINSNRQLIEKISIVLQ